MSARTRKLAKVGGSIMISLPKEVFVRFMDKPLKIEVLQVKNNEVTLKIKIVDEVM